MSVTEGKGRLVVDGLTGRLFLDDGEDGIFDENGDARLQEVAHDPDLGIYVHVNEGEPSHNERHSKNQLSIAGTHGPLFDSNGNQVADGDPHHVHPTADDPHFDPEGTQVDRFGNRTFTKVQWDEDNEAEHLGRMIPTHDGKGDVTMVREYGDPTLTGHTEAYTS